MSLQNFSGNRALWEGYVVFFSSSLASVCSFDLSSLKGNARRAHLGPTGKRKTAGPRQKTLQRREALVESSAYHSDALRLVPAIFDLAPAQRWNQAQHMADLQRASFFFAPSPFLSINGQVYRHCLLSRNIPTRRRKQGKILRQKGRKERPPKFRYVQVNFRDIQGFSNAFFVKKLMKQGLEDANSKLNTLVDCLNLPTVPQVSSSASTQVAPSQSGSFHSLRVHPLARFLPTSSDFSAGCLSHTSQLNEPAWTTTSFCSVPLPPPSPFLPPPHVEHRPTRSITLAGRFKLSFLETDVPHVPSISFADDLDALNSMWDDTSSYWKGHSALVINNFPIAITYWKQVYTSKNGKNWKPGQWKILKGRFFEWRVSMRTSLGSNVLTLLYLSKVLVERYRRGSPAEFWSTFTANGNRWNYKAILKHLADERASQNKLDAEAARREYGSDFNLVFAYNRNGVQCIKSKDSDIAKQYRALRQGETNIDEDDS